MVMLVVSLKMGVQGLVALKESSSNSDSSNWWMMSNAALSMRL